MKYYNYRIYLLNRISLYIDITLINGYSISYKCTEPCFDRSRRARLIVWAQHKQFRLSIVNNVRYTISTNYSS